jgi:heme/copper-type cytochrome/quinol oxidase subunit 2
MSKIIITIIVIIIVTCLGYLVYQLTLTPEELTENDTTNWNTYRDEEYRFEMKYPKEWKVETEETSILFIDTTKIDVSYPKGLLVFIINVGETTFNSIYDWFNKEFQDRSKDLVPEYSELIVNESQALRFSDPISMGGCEEFIVFIKNLRIYRLERTGPTCEHSDELFNQILSTFRFIE